MCEESQMDVNLVLIILLVCVSVVAVAGGTLRLLLKRRYRRQPSRKSVSSSHSAADERPLIINEGDVQMQADDSLTVTHLRNRTKGEIDVMITGMVRVSAVDIVHEKLNAECRWITIKGNAGDGKTTVGYLVLNELLQKGIKVFVVYKPEEYDHIAMIKGDRVIMLDDRFGEIVAEEHLIKGWLDVIRKLFSCKDNYIRVIFVSRTNVVNESRMYLGQFNDKIFNSSCIVDLSKLGDINERLNIIGYHLEQENVTVSDELKKKVSKKDIAHGFPHCCKMYSKLRSNGFDVKIEDFFESPLMFLDMTTKVLYTDNCKLLFQRMIKNDGQFDVYSVEDDDLRQKFLKVMMEQDGSYISVRNGICQFAHPSVYESVLNAISEIDPLYCVKYASLSVIRQKMLIQTSDKEERTMPHNYIIVEPIPAVLKALAERFHEDIRRGDYSVFTHRLCQSREFCDALISCCVGTDKTEGGSKQFINKQGEDGETMLLTALKGGHMIAAKALLRAQGDMKIQDDRRTPLHFLLQLNSHAAADDDDDGGNVKHIVIMDIIKLIIPESRGYVNVRDRYGQTPLHYFCQHKLSPAHTDENRSDMDTLRQIITEGRGDINISDQYGHTPLHYLFKYNAVTKEDIQWIITEGKGDLNKCEQNKSTPLHYLCANSDLQLDTADLVVTVGKGDFDKVDEHGTTPLHFLCKNNKVDFNVVKQIVNKTKSDINKRDNNGITPLHVLCKGSVQIESILTLINQKNKPDRHGNTPLHLLCKRQELDTDGRKCLEKIDLTTPNYFGHTPSDYLKKEGVTKETQDTKTASQHWTEGMIDRSAADLVVCQFQQGETWTAVLGPKMTMSSKRVHKLLQVEDFGRQLSNVRTCGNRERPGQFSWFYGTSVPIPFQNVKTSYWEINSRLTWTETKRYILLQMGLVQGSGNLDKNKTVSTLRRSVCVSVTSCCHSHADKLCIQILRRDLTEDKSQHVGKCVTQSLPKPDEIITFAFGLVLDISKGLVAFIDLEKKRVLQTVHQKYAEKDVYPMFHVPALNETFDTRMRLISGREIALSDWKIQLIQQVLSD